MGKSKRRVLIVEDDHGIRELLEELLKEEYDLVVAECQKDAFTALKRSPNGFDVVLLDLRLPVTKNALNPNPNVGLGVLKQIRKNGLFMRETRSPLPVVLMTAYGDSQVTVKEMVHLGIEGCFAKPFGRDELKAGLKSAVMRTSHAVDRSTAGRMAQVQIAFDAKKKRVLVDELGFLDGVMYDVFYELNKVFQEDLRKKKSPKNFGRLRGKSLATNLNKQEPTIRKEILRIRKKLQSLFGLRGTHLVEDSFVIEGSTPWKGYRLNPYTVRVVDPREIRDDDPRRSHDSRL